MKSVVQNHALARRDNSMRAGIEKDHGWGDSAIVWESQMQENIGQEWKIENTALGIKWKAQKSKNKSVTDHFAMSWTKWVNALKGKPGYNSRKNEGWR